MKSGEQFSKKPSVNPFDFCRVDQTAYKKILEWLRQPHVTEFFHGEGLQNTLQDLKAQVISGNSQYQHWIASRDGVQFGYLITSNVNPQDDEDDRFARNMSPGESAITLDVMIGDEDHLGQRLASLMIRTFLLNKFQQVTKVFIDPEVANTKATHVYEKIGFKKIDQFTAEWHPVPHWLMMVKMENLRDRI